MRLADLLAGSSRLADLGFGIPAGEALRVLEAEPRPVQTVPEPQLVEVATVFADLADLKTPHSHGHSRGVARLTREAAERLGLPPDDLGLAGEEFEIVRAQPSWPARVAAAHTVPRELRTIPESTFDRERAARITVPTLLLIGSESPDWQAENMAAALPDARIAVLDGQAHVADLLAPELVAKHLVTFLRERS